MRNRGSSCFDDDYLGERRRGITNAGPFDYDQQQQSQVRITREIQVLVCGNCLIR
jgi:hypothetical protein